MMYQSSLLINLLTFITYTTSQGKHYGCYEGDSCILSSNEYTFSSQDILYCTSSIKLCIILCLSPNSCQSLTIYSAANSTNIICNSTESCYDTTIRIGDTSIYPMPFKPHHFTNNNPITSNINCGYQESCSFLSVYFDGTEDDECTISSTHPHSFYNGYFDCNIMDHRNVNRLNNNNGCNLFCGDIFNNECLEATLYCNSGDHEYCKCYGDNCILQEIAIYSDALSSTSFETVNTSFYSSSIASSTVSNLYTLSLFESITFKLILISLIIIIVLLAFLLLICCWKFETIYDFVESKKNKNNERIEFKPTVSRSERTSTHESIEQHKRLKTYHSKHHSDTASTTDKDEMKTKEERMPSSWYKYKESIDIPQTQISTPPLSVPAPTLLSPESVISVISVLSELSSAPSEKGKKLKDRRKIKKPTKQNKNRNTSNNIKRKDYKKVKMNIKNDYTKQKHIKRYETDSETLTSSTEIDGENDSTDDRTTEESYIDSSSSTDSSSSSSSSSSSEEVKDGDTETQTKHLLNVDDMVVNMVLMMQNTPVTDNDNKKNMNNKGIGYNDIV